MHAEDVWTLIEEELPRSRDGCVDWSRRPFAKRWSWRRLGRGGATGMLGEVIALERRCFLLPSDSDEASLGTTTLRRGLLAFDQAPAGQARWLIDHVGRWVLELNPQGTLSLEFVRARNTRMLERLRKGELQQRVHAREVLRERALSAPAEPPVSADPLARGAPTGIAEGTPARTLPREEPDAETGAQELES